jgi:GTP-binding protein
MLAHLVSLENENPMKAYKEIRKELGAYDKTLLEKEEVIILTKIDTLDLSNSTIKKSFEKLKKDFEKLGKPIFVISLYEDESVKKMADGLVKLLRK